MPLAPLVMDNQLADSVAVHEHPDAAVTAIAPVAAVLVRDTDVGDAVNVHAAPVWVIATVCPATVKEPARAVVDVFGEAV